MKKRYEVKGMMEWHPEFRIGRSRLKVSFTGGHLCGGASTAAAFETSDPVVQAVIERSAPFRLGRIRLRGGKAGICLGAAGRLPSGKERLEANVHLTVMEFDNIDKASDFLQDKKGIPLDRLITPEQIHEEARRLGLELKLKKSPSQ